MNGYKFVHVGSPLRKINKVFGMSRDTRVLQNTYEDLSKKLMKNFLIFGRLQNKNKIMMIRSTKYLNFL